MLHTLKKVMLNALVIVSLSVLIVESSEARRCCYRSRGGSVAAGMFAGAVAGAVAAGAYEYDYSGPYYNPYYVPPRTRVFYSGAPIYAYDYPAASYAPIYSYPYDTMFAPGYYRPIY